MHMMIKITATLTGILALSGPVLATTPGTVPEPGILGLLVAGGLIGAVCAVRNRRK